MNNNTSRLSGANNNSSGKKTGNQNMIPSAAANNSGSTSGNRQMAALIVGLVVIVLLWVLGNYIYKYYSENQKSKVVKSLILSSPHNGQAEFDIGSAELANSGYSNEYSISFWVYVDDYSYRQGQPKFIMRRGNIKTGVNPEVYLDPSVNALKVNVSMMGNSNLNPMSGPESPTTTTQPQTTQSQTSTSTSPQTTQSQTTTTTIPQTTQPFTDIPKSMNAVDGSYNSDSAAAPGLIANPLAILGKLNNNAAHTPDVYDSSYFGLISGNEVGTITQAGVVDMNHNPELNVVLEQFGNPTDPTASCECPESAEKSTLSAAERAEFEAKAGRCMVAAFPLQKWVHVVISQYNQVLDVYIDGKLSSSCVLPGFPDVVQDDLVLSPDDGFSGKITKVVYLNSAVSADDAYGLYADGPDHYDTLLSRVPNWAWGVLALVILAVIIYSM